MFEILVPAIAGLITGAIGSLVAPWAQWGIEKKRLQHQVRSTLVAEVRAALVDPPSNKEFRVMPIYSRLRPHLSEAARRSVEGSHGPEQVGEVILLVSGAGRHSGVNPYAQRVLDELADLEQRWGLI